MKITKPFQDYIEKLAKKHSVDLDRVGSHFRLDMPGYMRLCVEVIGKNFVSVAHYYEQNGDLMQDPDVVFWCSSDGWIPFEITQASLGVYRSYLDCSGKIPVCKDLKMQQDLASFCNTWDKNLRAQGWLENATLTRKSDEA